MGKHGLSATEIGAPYGLVARVTNRLLESMGVIEQSENGWVATELGEKYVRHVHDDTGYGGYAFKNWSKTYFDPAILDELDITPDLIEHAKVVDAADRAKKALERATRQEAAEAAFRAFQEEQLRESGGTDIDWRKVAIILGGAIAVVGGVVVVKRYGPSLKQRWDEVAVPRFRALKRRIPLARGDESEDEPVHS